jgi:hypothetical protein
MWIRKDLVREGRVHPDDCHPVSQFQKVALNLKTLSFSRDICGGGGGAGVRETFMDVLKKAPMAEGGRWVRKPDKPVHPVNWQIQDARGRMQGVNQGFRPPPPPRPPHQ